VADEEKQAVAAKPAAAPEPPAERAPVGEPPPFDPFEQEELPEVVTGEAAVSEGGAGVTSATPDASKRAGEGDGAADLAAIRQRWKVVVEELKRARAITTSALLAEAEPVRCEGDTLVIGFRYSIHRDKWDRGENRQHLIAALQSIFGRKMAVRSEVLEDRQAGTGPSGGAHGAGRGRGGGTGSTGEKVAAGGERAGVPEPGTAVPSRSTARGANGSGALEGEALLHEVIAAFDGQIVEDSRE
jgi:hypothetical protein